MTKDSTEYNIIVIEDNIGDFILFKDYLEDVMTNTIVNHFTVFKDFLNYFVSHINVTDIIFLDASTTDKASGESLIKDALQIAANTPIVVLTGFTNFPLVKKSLALGVSDYLIKDDLNPTVLYKSIVYNIERNKNLTQLKLSQQLYLDLFNKSPLPMYVFDSTSLHFLDVNETALSQYGYTRAEFLNLKLTDIKLKRHEVEQKVAKLEFVESVSDQSTTIEYHSTKDDKIIIIDTNEVTIIYEDTFAKLAALQNITKNLERQYALKLRNERLKNIAWSQSHNVRAPLARILGIINALEDESMSVKEKKILMKSLTESGLELDTVIEKVIKNTTFID